MIGKIKHMIANSYIVRTSRLILVDTGAPNSAKAILKRLEGAGLSPQDIDLILLTHAHSDHAGSAKSLSDLSGAPVAVHQGDAAMLQRGNNGRMLALGIEARFSQPFVDRPFAGIAPDMAVLSGEDLSQFDLPAQFLHTPGHTPGSISLIFDNGDAIVGDILRGGVMGGNFMAQKPNYPYFLEDMAHKATLLASIQRVLNAGAKRLFVGHGGPLSREDVEIWLGKQH